MFASPQIQYHMSLWLKDYGRPRQCFVARMQEGACWGIWRTFNMCARDHDLSHRLCADFRIEVANTNKWFWSIYPIYHLGDWNKLFLRDIYTPIVGVGNDGVLDDMILLFIISCLVPNVCFHCIIQDSWMCVVLVLSAICVPFTNSSVEFYFILRVVTIVRIFMAILFILNYMFRLSSLSNYNSANTYLPGCFCSWTFLLNIGLNMLPLDSFVSCLDSLLGCFTGEFQAFQVIARVVFGAVN